MSKIKSIKIVNFKAISEFEADFNGCTAIVTAGNNKGKTSLLRGITDRIRFMRPEVKVKAGETKGKGEMELTSGEKFVWEFDNAKLDKLTLIETGNVRRNVTQELGAKYFPELFDIDKFLNEAPAKQSARLQKIIGLDFSDVDKRYSEAYAARTARNLESEKYHVKLSAMLKVDKVDAVDLAALQAKQQAEKDRLNKLYISNKQSNTDKRSHWESECRKVDDDVNSIIAANATIHNKVIRCENLLDGLKKDGYSGKEVHVWIETLKKELKPTYEAKENYPIEPGYITPELPARTELDKIDAEILSASETNEKARQYKEYIEYKASTEEAKEKAEAADILVKSIEDERKKMIASAKFPKGITIGYEGIMVDGLPFDRNQISTSLLYCSALRIASMNLGEVKTLYFDASFLDRNSLVEIEKWANENDLQLLIERPDFEGGEIKYELIENEA